MRADNRPTHKVFLPGVANVLIPLGQRPDALAAFSLYSPSRQRAVTIRNAAWWYVRMFGPRSLPGRTVRWHPSIDARSWSNIIERLNEKLGPHSSLAAYRPRDRYRRSFGFLWMADGDARAFVKVCMSNECSHHEWMALNAVSAQSPQAFHAPAPLMQFTHDEWSVVAMSALASPLHKPAYVEPEPLAIDIGRCLRELGRPSDAPEHWRPMHGDLTPWNLRVLGRDRPPALLDWETASWGPPGADEVLYRASTIAMGRRRREPWRPDLSEARRYWSKVIPNRTTSLDSMNRAVLQALEHER